nr:LanC-like protein GCL2 [Tanacetum cinerariifolium]
MSDRYFDNFMLEYVEEKASVPGIEEEQDDNQDSLMKLLKMPYPTLCEKLKRTALDLKETIVVETWGVTGQKVQDFTIYTGTLGTAFLLLKSYQVTNNKNDLDLSSEIIKACDYASSNSSVVSFLSGRAGVCALGAVVAKHQGNEQMVDYYLTQFKKIKVTKDDPVELIRGRTGYLWACLFLNKNLGDGTIPSTHTSPVVDKIIENGREMGVASRCPLMFEYCGDIYWGAAHGLAGIMYVLMHFGLPPDAFADIVVETWGVTGQKVQDFTIYTGTLGTAFLLLKSYQVTNNKNDLDLCSEIIKACDYASSNSRISHVQEKISHTSDSFKQRIWSITSMHLAFGYELVCSI